MEVTSTGLSGEQFKEIRAALIADAVCIINAANSNTGHLGDIVSCIKTTQSSLEIKTTKLWSIFQQQKNPHANP